MTKSNPYEIRYVYSGNAKIAMIRNNQTYYFINDVQGTPERITDSTGKVVQKIQMDEWGQIEKVKGPFLDEINFTGKKLDPETGFYYFNQRYYDPETMRFTAQDPAKQDVNPYTYCANNPCNLVDPNGEFAFGPIVATLLNAAFFAAASEVAISYIEYGRGPSYENLTNSALSGAVSGGLFYGVGSVGQAYGWNPGSWQKVALHTAVGGTTSMLVGGGRFQDGAIGAGISQMLAPGIDEMNSASQRIFSAAAVGGFASAFAGGDFYSGALAAGFGRAFNDEGHPVNGKKDGVTWKNGAPIAEDGLIWTNDIETAFGIYSLSKNIAAVNWFEKNGLLNSNKYVRIGWSWKGTRTEGSRVFRIAFGNKKAPIHTHIDLWE